MKCAAIRISSNCAITSRKSYAPKLSREPVCRRSPETSFIGKREDMQTKPELPPYAQLFIEGLKEAGVSVVGAVPESLLAGVYRGCARDNSLRYIPVTNEGELPG